MCGSMPADHKILGKRLNKAQGKNPKKKTGITTTICKCKKCGLIFSNPQPIPLNIQDHYGVPPEDYWNESYFLLDESYFKYEITKTKTLMPFNEGMKALDIGAGIGKAMIAMKAEGFVAYGIEPSLPFYQRAIEKMGINSQNLMMSTIEDAEYPKNHFDFVTFGAVFEHVEDPAKCLKKALDWTKPGGIIYIGVPSAHWLISKFANAYYKCRCTDYVGNLSPMHSPFHLYEFSPRSFELHAKDNHYEIALLEYSICDTFLPKSADFILKPIMRYTNTGMELNMGLRKK